jgi:hypothetical protein
VQIVASGELSDQQRELYQQLADSDVASNGSPRDGLWGAS